MVLRLGCAIECDWVASYPSSTLSSRYSIVPMFELRCGRICGVGFGFRDAGRVGEYIIRSSRHWVQDVSGFPRPGEQGAKHLSDLSQIVWA